MIVELVDLNIFVATISMNNYFINDLLRQGFPNWDRDPPRGRAMTFRGRIEHTNFYKKV